MESDRLCAPISLQVELTDNCPHLCKHCYNFIRYAANGRRRVYTPINLATLETITDNIIRNEVFHVTLSGGEPAYLGTERLEVLLQKYHDAGVQISFNSSLSTMPNEMADLLSKYRVSVLVSIPSSDPAKYSMITDNPAGLSHVVKNVGKLAERNVRVSANMVVTTDVVQEVYATGLFAVHIGCSGFNATRMSPSSAPGAEDHKSMVLDNVGVLSMFEQLARVREECDIPVGTLNALPYCAVPEPQKYRSILERSCVAGLTSAGIGANGDVRGCQHFAESYGNLLREELKDVWSRIPVWKKEYPNDHCKGCVVKDSCGGGCRENSLVMNGRMDAPDSLIANGSGKITTPWNKPSSVAPQGILLKSGLIVREEKFGGILFRNPSQYAPVDMFFYEVLPYFFGGPITVEMIETVGRTLEYATPAYIKRTFLTLVRRGVAEPIHSAEIDHEKT